MELNTYIMDRITELETRIELLESVLKSNNINIPKAKTNIIEDKNYPFVLKVANKIQHSDHYDCWTETMFEPFYWDNNNDVNGFETAEEAVDYVKTHPEIFTGVKIYLCNENTNIVRKIKKGY